MVSLNLPIYTLTLMLLLPSLSTCFQHNWWTGLRNSSSNQQQARGDKRQTWTSPLPSARERIENNWSSVTPSVVTSAPLSNGPSAVSSSSTSPFASSSWTPVITSSFNSMQSTGLPFSFNRLETTAAPPVLQSQSNVTLNSKLNESLVDSSSTLRRSASRYADEFDSIISSKSFAPIIRATSKELIREKEIYFDHENYNDANSKDESDKVAWDDRIEFPPSTTTTITLNLPESTSQPLKEVKSNDQVSTVDHRVNGNSNGGASSAWFTSSSTSTDKSDKLQQRKSKSNLVKKSGRNLDRIVATEASIASTTPVSSSPSIPRFVDSLDLKAAYEKEISEIQSGAISGEKYEDLSDSFKFPARQVSKSSAQAAKSRQTQENKFSKKTSPLIELITTLSPPSTASRSSKQQRVDGVKGGKLVKSEKQKQAKDTFQNGQVTSYFNWGKSDPPATTNGQVVTTPISPVDDTTDGRVGNLQLTNKKNKSDRQTIGNRKGQVKVSKQQSLQGTKSTKLTLPTRLTSNNDNDNSRNQNAPPSESEEDDGEIEAVTFSPISTATSPSSTSTTTGTESQRLGRSKANQSKQTLWSAAKASRLVDSVSDLKRLSPPSTGSNRLSRAGTLSPRGNSPDSQLFTTTSSPLSSSLPVTSATRSSSLEAAFDSAFRAAVTRDEVTPSTANNNNNKQKQKQVKRKGAKTQQNASVRQASPSIGGKSSFTVETSDFGWSTDINHNGNGNSEVKLTRKSGIINPPPQSDKLIKDEIDDDVVLDDEISFTTTLSPITTTEYPITTTARFESTSKTTRKRVSGGITRSTTTRKPSTSTRKASTTTSSSTTSTASSSGGSFVSFTDEEDKSTSPSARLQGEAKGGASRSTLRPERLEAEVADEDEITDSKLTKKSGIQYNNLQLNPLTSYEREDGEALSGEQIDGSVEKNEDDCRLEDAIPGTPLTDYPTYQTMPVTSFKCSDVQYPGYYGDVEAQCQVFHVCQTDGRKNDFLCPIGTIFNQELLVCDWWQNFRCADTANYFSANENLYLTSEKGPASVNNQLRKRTDALEREGDNEAANDRDNTGDDNVSEEIDDNDYESSRERSNVDAELPTAVSSPPGPIVEARIVAEAVKGGKSSVARYTEAVKQLTLTAPRSIKSVKKTTRVAAGYGARLISLDDTLDSVALASNLAKVTRAANSTSPTSNKETMSTVVTLPSISSTTPKASSSSSPDSSSHSSSSTTSSPSQHTTTQYVSPLQGITSSSSLFSPIN